MVEKLPNIDSHSLELRNIPVEYNAINSESTSVYTGYWRSKCKGNHTTNEV